jgi:hypothetical protein
MFSGIGRQSKVWRCPIIRLQEALRPEMRILLWKDIATAM